MLRLPLAVAVLASWLTTSVAAFEVAVDRDVPYRSAAGDDHIHDRCAIDLYRPVRPVRPPPVMVWFHGGALEMGDRQDRLTVVVAKSLAGDGFAVALAGYRLSPRVKAPAYLEDAAAAVAWTLEHAQERGLDAGSVFIGGHSAGGYIALMLAADPQYLAAARVEPGRVAGVVAVSGQTFTHFTIRKEQGIPNPANTPVIDRFAPCWHAARAKSMPPLLLICGDQDWVARVEENRYFYAMLKSCGAVSADYREIPGRTHVTILAKMADSDDPGRIALTDFVESHRAGR